MDSKSLKNLQSVSPKDHSSETGLKVAQWFSSCHLKKLWTDRRMEGQTDDDDGQ